MLQNPFSMRSISIINTGIQLINVIEAIKYHDCSDNYLIIGQFNLFPNRIKQIEKMLEDDFLKQHFKKIYSLPKQFSPKNPLRFLGYILAYIKFAWIILLSKKFDFCYSGVYTDIIMRPINFLAWYKNKNITLCLIDEGVRIIEDAKNRLILSNILQKQARRKTFFLRDFYLAITKRWHPPTITFFTVYNFSTLDCDCVTANPYSFFKKQNAYPFTFEPNAVVVIGQPYVELKIISANTYGSTLNRILSDYINHPKYYVPHPMETLYISMVPTHFQIVKSQYPIELLLLGTELNAIVGFNSSVLFNAAKMQLCKNIKSYIIKPIDYISTYNREATERLYESFKEAGIELVY